MPSRARARGSVRDLDALPDRPHRPVERARRRRSRGTPRRRRRPRRARCRRAASTQPTGFGQVEPLVRVDRDRVGALEPAEERRGAGRRGRGSAVRAVDVEPHAVLGADVGNRVEGIDGAGAGGAGDAHDGDRRDAGGAIGLDRAGELVGAHAQGVVAADDAQRAAAEAEHVAGAADRVVRVLAGVDRGRSRRHAVLARFRQRSSARRGETGQVGVRAAAREVPDAGREADQLGEPAPRDRPRPRRRRRCPQPRLASSAAASTAAATPASRPEPSMNGNERGCECESERGSTSLATRSTVASRPTPVRGSGTR